MNCYFVLIIFAEWLTVSKLLPAWFILPLDTKKRMQKSYYDRWLHSNKTEETLQVKVTFTGDI